MIGHNWKTFSDYIRTAVSGSLVVAEVLSAVLDNNQSLIDQIVSEHTGKRDVVSRFVIEAREEAMTISGRATVRQVAAEHAYLSTLPTDDISLRRVYNAWRRHTVRRAA